MKLTGVGSANEFQNRWELKGKERDLTFGLNRVNFGARVYNPTIGRWDRMDNFSEAAPNLSGYRYSFNNPVNVTDPDGNFEYSDGYSMNSSNSGSVSITSFNGIYSTGRAEPEGQGTPQQGGGCGGQGQPPCPEEKGVIEQAVEFFVWGLAQIGNSVNRSQGNLETTPMEDVIAGTEYATGMAMFIHGTNSILPKRGGNLRATPSRGTIGKNNFSIDPNKFNYFFGRVTNGSPHNLQRSAQNLKDLTTLGVRSENQLMIIFNQALNNGNVVSTRTTQYGTTISRSVSIGNKGQIDVGFFYKNSNMQSTPSVTTIIPKIYK